MVKDIKITDSQLESFCKDFLMQRGYTCVKTFEYYKGKPISEQDILSRFYSLNSKEKAIPLSEGLKNVKADTLILRKLINRFVAGGISYQSALQNFADVIEFLYEDVSKFGGPFLSFRIFSSEEFVESVLFGYEKSREERNQTQWDKDSKIISSQKEVDMKSIIDNLKKMRERIKHG